MLLESANLLIIYMNIPLSMLLFSYMRLNDNHSCYNDKTLKLNSQMNGSKCIVSKDTN